MSLEKDLSCIMVVFGGTGDLMHRKLMPAIYNLLHENMLPESFAIVSIGRRDITDDEYRNQVKGSIAEFSRFEMEGKLWDKLKDRIYYSKFDFSDDEGYSNLNNTLKSVDKNYDTKGNRIYYLAVAPEAFELITDKLNNHEMVLNDGSSWQRIVIEKPFGRDLKSAKHLNKKITEVFKEENTYRIDHYLGKEMIQNIMVIRFANEIFEQIWNNKFIDNIQITSSETVGVENRGSYYERAGALRDMVQNHILQLVTMIAMEPPTNLDTESIRDEKVKILRSIESLNADFINENVIRGQYGRGILDKEEVVSYREENKVSKDSEVETFVALKLNIQNFRWAGVPFYIRTGKRLKERYTEVVVQFKHTENILYFKEYNNLLPNLLVIKIQPREGVFFQFNGKEPGNEKNIIPVQMDFCQNCNFENNSPEAYEKLILDVIEGDSTLFARWDEVECSWSFVDNILEVWRNERPAFPNYEAGSEGPKEAEDLLANVNRKWWKF